MKQLIACSQEALDFNKKYSISSQIGNTQDEIRKTENKLKRLKAKLSNLNDKYKLIKNK